MRKLISFIMISLDGYHEAPDRSLAWANLAEDFHQHSISQLNNIGTLLFGRVTYEGMVAYWTSEAAKELPEVAERMRALPKVVVSTSLREPGWNNVAVVSGDAAQAVRDLKQQDGKDLAIMGSSSLTSGLIEDGLVDEVRCIIMPRLLGEGHGLFAGLKQSVDLQLLRATMFASGNLLACYRPVPANVS